MAITGLLSIRLTLGYLGAERFGLWMTVASLQTVFSFTDFGLGYAVIHTVSEAYGHSDMPLIVRSIWTAIFAQTALVLLILAIFFLLFPLFDWARLFHVSGNLAISEAAPTVAIFVPLILLRSIVQVVQQAQYGMQSGYIANSWSAVGNFAGLIGLVVSAHAHSSVPILCLVVSGLPLIAGIANVTWWLTRRLPRNHAQSALVPGAHSKLLRRMLKTGFLFFLLQLAAQLNLGIDPLIVNQVMGSAAVATLTIVQKPFDLLAGSLLLLLQPLWPAYREALVSNDIPWIRKTFGRALIISLTFAIAVALIMMLAGTALIRLWAGSSAHPSKVLVFAYCAAFLFSAIQTPVSFFLNALGKLRFQLILALPVIIGSLLLKILLTPCFGLFVIPATSVVVGLIIMLPVQVIYIRSLFSKLSRKHNLPGNSPGATHPSTE